MLNAATLAAIVAAVWASPGGVSYLEKIERLAQCQTVNPCCVKPGGGSKKRPDYLTAKHKEPDLAHIEDDEMLQLIITAVTRNLL